MKPIISSARLALVCLFTIALLSFECSNGNASKSTGTAQKPKADFSKLLTEQQFNTLFPQRDKFYTYKAFITAVNDLAQIKLKVIRRATSVYQFTRTDKTTGKATVVRQDADWNEEWAKAKPDSVYNIDFGNFCSEKDAAGNKREIGRAHV